MLNRGRSATPGCGTDSVTHHLASNLNNVNGNNGGSVSGRTSADELDLLSSHKQHPRRSKQHFDVSYSSLQLLRRPIPLGKGDQLPDFSLSLGRGSVLSFHKNTSSQSDTH